jgi:hypothetical protein
MIKKIACMVLMAAAMTPALAADVAVSVTVGEPGFYGQIDIGNFPQPRVVYAQPVVIQPPPQVVTVAPIYLHVPPGHEKHWNKHCAHYHACDRPVYFVRDDWYNNVYVPGYQSQKHEHGKGGDDDGDHHGHGKDHQKDHDKGNDDQDR